MAAFKVTDVSRIAAEVAGERFPHAHIVGVIGDAADGNYTEIIIDIAGCSREPCRVSVGILRNLSEEQLRKDIARKLDKQIRAHAA
jgi:hypothetical protein